MGEQGALGIGEMGNDEVGNGDVGNGDMGNDEVGNGYVGNGHVDPNHGRFWTCSHCNIINQPAQIRQIGYRSAVAVLSPIVLTAADIMRHADIRHRHRAEVGRALQ